MEGVSVGGTKTVTVLVTEGVKEGVSVSVGDGVIVGVLVNVPVTIERVALESGNASVAVEANVGLGEAIEVSGASITATTPRQ